MDSAEKMEFSKPQEKEQPFIREEVDSIAVPVIKEEGAYLKVNGEIVAGNGEDRLREIIRSDLAYDKDFLEVVLYKKDPSTGLNRRCLEFINPNKLDEKYPKVEFASRYQGSSEDFLVNGFNWKSLGRKGFFRDGIYHIDFDLDNKKTAISTTGYTNEPGGVVVNNSPWKTEGHNSKLKAKNNHVAALFEGYSNGRNLVIDDKNWQMPDDLSDKNENRRQQVIQEYDLNNSNVAAVVKYIVNEKSQYGVYLGDMDGKKNEWGNTFYWVDKIIVDKTLDSAAVVATREEGGKRLLVIDDIICETREPIYELQKLSMDNGELLIQYKSPLGEVIAEKIKLKTNAEEIEAKIKLQEKESEDLRLLKNFLTKENISPGEVIKKINKLNSEVQQAKEETIEIKKNYQEENNNLKTKLTEQDRAINGVKAIIKKMKKSTFGSSHALNGSDYENLIKILGER